VGWLALLAEYEFSMGYDIFSGYVIAFWMGPSFGDILFLV